MTGEGSTVQRQRHLPTSRSLSGFPNTCEKKDRAESVSQHLVEQKGKMRVGDVLSNRQELCRALLKWELIFAKRTFSAMRKACIILLTMIGRSEVFGVLRRVFSTKMMHLTNLGSVMLAHSSSSTRRRIAAASSSLPLMTDEGREKGNQRMHSMRGKGKAGDRHQETPGSRAVRGRRRATPTTPPDTFPQP